MENGTITKFKGKDISLIPNELGEQITLSKMELRILDILLEWTTCDLGQALHILRTNTFYCYESVEKFFNQTFPMRKCPLFFDLFDNFNLEVLEEEGIEEGYFINDPLDDEIFVSI